MAYQTLVCESYLCNNEERTFARAIFVKTPEVPISINKGFKECCYENLVLADLNSNEDYKNDYTGFFYQKQAPDDSCSFSLRDLENNSDYILNDDTYGLLIDFDTIENNLDLKYFILDWRKVLINIGTRNYQFIKVITIGGINTQIPSDTFYLAQYSIDRANGTTRFDSNHNGRMLAYGVDFKNSGFKTSLRTRGFFGNNNPTYIQENLIFSNNEKEEQISIEKKDKFAFEMFNVPECITYDFFNFNLLGNELFISDYNKNNHSYNLKKIPVTLGDSQETKYNSNIRNAIINLTFENRYKNSRNINY